MSFILADWVWRVGLVFLPVQDTHLLFSENFRIAQGRRAM